MLQRRSENEEFVEVGRLQPSDYFGKKNLLRLQLSLSSHQLSFFLNLFVYALYKPDSHIFKVI